MTHITTIGAGLYSDVSFGTDFTTGAWTLDKAQSLGTFTEANWKALFATAVDPGVAGGAVGKFRRITNIRELPQMGTPPNIVNVPTYGSKTSRQVQGQADAPTFEVTLNFVPSDWITTANYLGSYVGNGTAYPFRFALLNSEPSTAGATKYASLDTVTGISSAPGGNTQYFFGGKVEALQINPQLTDSNTAVLTISLQSEFWGPFTNT